MYCHLPLEQKLFIQQAKKKIIYLFVCFFPLAAAKTQITARKFMGTYLSMQISFNSIKPSF